MRVATAGATVATGNATERFTGAPIKDHAAIQWSQVQDQTMHG